MCTSPSPTLRRQNRNRSPLQQQVSGSMGNLVENMKNINSVSSAVPYSMQRVQWSCDILSVKVQWSYDIYQCNKHHGIEIITFPTLGIPCSTIICTVSAGLAETPIVVTWVTFTPTNISQVQYWLHGDPATNTTALGSSKKFVDPGIAKMVRYVHRVWLPTTVPTQYYGMFLRDCILE